MILDNLSRALKTQNWLAAAIEFVIVVAGVVIGFQINAWNEDRSRREAEDRLLARLHAQLQALESADAGSRRSAAVQGEALYTVRALMFGFETPRALTQAECMAVSISHQPPVQAALPFIDELIATGQINTINDRALQSAIALLASMRARDEIDTGALRAESYDLPVRFPNLIELGLERTDAPDDIDGYVPAPVCDTQGMLNDPAFRNMLSTNVANFNSYLLARREIEGQLDAVSDLLETSLQRERR